MCEQSRRMAMHQASQSACLAQANCELPTLLLLVWCEREGGQSKAMAHWLDMGVH